METPKPVRLRCLGQSNLLICSRLAVRFYPRRHAAGQSVTLPRLHRLLHRQSLALVLRNRYLIHNGRALRRVL